MLTKPRRPMTPYDIELQKWRKATHEALTQHRKDFWDSQTEVENKWMDEYTAGLNRKLNKQRIRGNENTIKLCKRTKEKLDFLAAKAKRQAAKAEARRAKEAADKASRERMITALNIDSQTWFTPENFEAKLSEEMIVPYALDFTDYYQDLRIDIGNSRAGLAIDSNLLYNNKNETVIRNGIIVPLFTDIKSVIRKMTYCEQTKLDHDFEAAKAVIRTEQRDNADEMIKSLRDKYVKLAAAVNHADFTPEVFIEKAYIQSVWLQELLLKWNQYINIARLDDRQIIAYFNVPGRKTAARKLDSPLEVKEEAKETWENDMEAANPEDSDEIPGEGPTNIKAIANEKEKMLESLSEFNPEQILQPKEVNPQAENKAMESFNMYTGENEINRHGLFTEKNESDTQAMMEFMFSSISLQYSEPSEVFEAPSVMGDPKHMLEPPEKKEFNPSFVLDRLRKTLSSFKDEELSLEARLKKNEILISLGAIENLRVIEPRLLHRVFKYHRYEVARFTLD